MLLLIWFAFVSGIIIPWLSKKLFQFILVQRLPEDDVTALTPLWSFWDLLLIITTGAFVLVVYTGKLFS